MQLIERTRVFPIPESKSVVARPSSQVDDDTQDLQSKCPVSNPCERLAGGYSTDQSMTYYKADNCGDLDYCKPELDVKKKIRTGLGRPG